MKTGRIKFNIKDRGRSHTGAARNFDVDKLVELINSPAIQERVRNRDLQGYLGHGIRQAFGMEPPEATISGGKLVLLEPAFVTTYLAADPDGTVEHEHEILDTVPGKSVRDQFAAKIGGFSSAIFSVLRGGFHIARSFHGFDYVKEPNFTRNRGYEMTFDSVGNAEELRAIFDSVMDEAGNALQHQQMLYESLRADHHRALQVVERLTMENNDLVGRAAAGHATFDSAGFQRPMRANSGDAAFAKLESFKTAKLAAIDVLPGQKDDNSTARARENARAELL